MITTVLPKDWPIQVIKGDRLPPLSIKVIDFNEDDFEDYEPHWYFYDRIGRPFIKELTEGSGLQKSGAVTQMDLTWDDQDGRFPHQLKVKVADWWFTVQAGDLDVHLHKTGGLLGLDRRVCKLPIVRSSEGVLQIVAEDGTPIISEDGSFIETES